MTIREARGLGILDDNLTTYTDLREKTTYSIQEAIDRQLLVATLDSSTSTQSAGTVTVSTSG